jgi:hypothetical protein
MVDTAEISHNRRNTGEADEMRHAFIDLLEKTLSSLMLLAMIVAIALFLNVCNGRHDGANSV